ncbi:MAG: SAM-dependent methyltransferase [Propionibacteriaceae bacterium]|jgi:23S rRNA (guanine745-N1)-methyltransferase|nr:SAM-dependent methyltransferase [Propionibacteriaceae bacterium]
MGLTAAAELLACPACRQPLGLVDAAGRLMAVGQPGRPKAARCSAGHSFDVARSGYLNLSQRPAPANADTADMVAARQRILSGHILDNLLSRLLRPFAGGVALEAGAGPAFFLSQWIDAAPDRIGLAVDISRAAARVAAQAHPRVASLVADIWQGLPVRDGVITTLFSMFAPRNLPDFERLLAPGGCLVVALPNPGHLAGLRQRFGLMQIHHNKLEDLIERMPASLSLEETSQVGLAFPATAEQVGDFIAMGPNAFHPRRSPITAAVIDLDISLLLWRKAGPRPPEAAGVQDQVLDDED